MLRSFALQWKILLSMLLLSVAPLVITLFVVSSLTEKQLEKDMKGRVAQVSNFVDRTVEATRRENANYVQLLAANADMVNAIYYTSLTGDDSQTLKVIQDAQKIFAIDMLEALDKEGSLLVRSLAVDQEIPSTTGKDHPLIQASLQGASQSAIDFFDGQLSIVTVTPVLLQQEQIGHLVGVQFLDDRLAKRIEDLSGAKVAFFSNNKVIAASNPALKNIDPEPALNLDGADLLLGNSPHTAFAKLLSGNGSGVVIAIDRSSMVAARRHVQEILVIVLVIAISCAIVIGIAISRGIIRPLAVVVENLKEISEGEGDLTRSLEVKTEDEVGELAENFNRFVAKLREMVLRSKKVAVDLKAATEKVRLISGEVNDGAVAQSAALDESHRAVQSIEENISGIAESTGALVDSAEISSSATLELGATIEEIASQMEKLFATVEEVSSSINQMSVSSQEISENVEILSSSTEVTASSIVEMDASIKEIEENAERTSQLSEEAARDALKGKEAVDETIQGINAIRETVDRAAHAIQELGNQSKAIGKILTVIDEVADQTSLLALNAAIIAAQAGEHGRGFAVVADEIRELAERTAVSTREIAAIINNLQKGTEEAVKAMTAGSDRVHEEVERSQAAGAALDQIRSSTTKATEQVRSIVRATQEQARGSRQITDSINQVASMLGQIAAAIKQQTDGTRQLAKAAEAMKEIASQGKLSTSEQAKGSRQINTSMEQIRTMIERIDEATREQTQRNRQVLEAIASISNTAEKTASRTGEMDQVVEVLTQQAASLEEEVGAFKA